MRTTLPAIKITATSGNTKPLKFKAVYFIFNLNVIVQMFQIKSFKTNYKANLLNFKRLLTLDQNLIEEY